MECNQNVLLIDMKNMLKKSDEKRSWARYARMTLDTNSNNIFQKNICPVGHKLSLAHLPKFRPISKAIGSCSMYILHITDRELRTK